VKQQGRPRQARLSIFSQTDVNRTSATFRKTDEKREGENHNLGAITNEGLKKQEKQLAESILKKHKRIEIIIKLA